MISSQSSKDQATNAAPEDLQHLIMQGTMTPPNMSELLQSIVAWALELLRADEGTIFLWDQERQELRQSTGYHYSEVYHDRGIRIKPGQGVAGRVILSGEPMIVADYQSWRGRIIRSSVPLSPHITNLSVPMNLQDQSIGVLSIDADNRRRTFSQDDVRLSTIFANVAAVAIENARLYEVFQDQADELEKTLKRAVAERTAELAYRALQLETSARISREITSILDIDKLLTTVVELIRQAFGYYSVMVFLVDNRTSRLELRSASGDIGRQLMQQSLSMEIGPGSLNSEVAQTNTPIIVNDVREDPRYRFLDLLPDTRSELVIPLRLGRQMLGTLDVQSDKLNAFSPEDKLVIQSLGDQVAIAIHNAYLYDSNRELAIMKERNRLARELHDSVTQTIFSMTLVSESARILLERDPNQVSNRLDRLYELAQGALEQIRSLVFQLRPETVTEANFITTLNEHIVERQRMDGLHVTLQVEGEGDIPAEWKGALFRIVQEALNNVIKHARTDQAAINLCLGDDIVTLEIVDHGQGMPSIVFKRPSTTLGLTSMRERTELIGGTFNLKSVIGEGTTVRVEIPRHDR